MLAGTHPDTSNSAPPGAPSAWTRWRDLIHRVSIKPFEGGRHTVIIDDAEKLTPQAQNALLKTLETPPGGAVFFLLTTTPSQLLPTIVSRCRHERFHAVSTEDATKALTCCRRATRPRRTGRCLASGCVGRALEQLSDAGYWSLRERVMKSLAALKGPWAVAEAAKPLASDRESAPVILEIMEALARDMMRASAGLPSEQPGFDRDQISLDGGALLSGVSSARRKPRRERLVANGTRDHVF
jgi:DNA polymerase-3 subunit delta'